MGITDNTGECDGYIKFRQATMQRFKEQESKSFLKNRITIAEMFSFMLWCRKREYIILIDGSFTDSLMALHKYTEEELWTEYQSCMD